jgi:hypothetical protein
LKLIAKKRSRSAASASSRSASAGTKTSGFSTSSGMPARITASVGSKCVSFGRQSDTRSGCSTRIISVTSV